MCFYSAPWPSYYIAHSLQLPVVSKLIRNLNVMASQLKKKKKAQSTKEESAADALEPWDLLRWPEQAENKSKISISRISDLC